jgi:hypothetical protein
MYYNIIDHMEKKPHWRIWLLAILVNIIMGFLDHLTGSQVKLDIFYVIPVGMIAWIINRNAGFLMMFISIITVFLADILGGKTLDSPLIEFWNILANFCFFAIIIVLVSDEKIKAARNKELVAELREAMEEVKVMSGFLPICASCKKIRDDDGYWEQIESYISQHTDATFSHSLCPECLHKLYPEFEKKK